MDVTDVLRDRVQEPAGLQRMIVISLVVHAVLFAVILFAPGGWLTSAHRDDLRTVMTISLGGGGEGPQNGGLTQMGGRPVQVATPPEPKPVREAVRAPAAKAPEMTVPERNAKPTRAASAAVKQAPDEARGRTPTKGATTSAGSAVAMTGARGQGFGLSSGGGPGTGATLDVADFCCPDYLVTMSERIKSNSTQQTSSADPIVKFTIRRDGILQDISIERSSGSPIADLAAQRAVILTHQLPPLPAGFPNPTLTVHLTFQYQR